MARSSQYPPSVDPGPPVEPPTPAGWSRRTFGELLEVIERPLELDDTHEYQLVNAKRSRGGIAPRERLKGSDIRVKTQFRVETGDFLVSKRQIIHGACGVVPKELDGAVVSNEYCVLRPRDGLDLGYLRCLSFTSYFQRTCFHSSVGVDVEKMVFKLDQWFRYSTPIPPLPEQRRIAAVMALVDEVVARSEESIAQIEVLKRATMSELLSRGLPAREHRCAETSAGRIPSGWAVEPLGAVFSVQLGKMLSKAAKTGVSPKPYLRNANVQWGRIDLSDVSTMDFQPDEQERFVLKRGDLLVCEGGEIGRCAIWSGDIEDCFYQKALHRLRPKDDRLSAPFLALYLEQRFRYESFFGGQKGHSTIAHLPKEKLEVLPVAIPSRDEQERIVEAVDTVRVAHASEAATLVGLQRLRSALLSALLSGRTAPSDAGRAA